MFSADLSITPINSDGEVIALLGNDLRLTCTSNSTPISFQWTHNEVLISNAVSNILQLIGVNHSNAERDIHLLCYIHRFHFVCQCRSDC